MVVYICVRADTSGFRKLAFGLMPSIVIWQRLVKIGKVQLWKYKKTCLVEALVNFSSSQTSLWQLLLSEVQKGTSSVGVF